MTVPSPASGAHTSSLWAALTAPPVSPWKHAVGGGLEGRDGTGGAPGTSSWHAGSTRRTTASSRGHRAQEPTRPLQPRGAGAEHHSHRSVGPCPRPATCTPTLQSGNYTHSTDGETEPQKEEATCFLKFTNIQACLTPTSPLRALTLPPNNWAEYCPLSFVLSSCF